jgi:hypothetical protein
MAAQDFGDMGKIAAPASVAAVGIDSRIVGSNAPSGRSHRCKPPRRRLGDLRTMDVLDRKARLRVTTTFSRETLI